MEFEEIKNLNNKELIKLLSEKRKELENLRFSAHGGQLKQVHKISLVKKDIARILTVLKTIAK